MVKPGGTGRPRLAISARLAPLPPKRSRNSALPSALPSPNVNTHLPAFTAGVAFLTAGGALLAACGALLVACGALLAATGLGAGALDTTLVDALAATFGAALTTGLAGVFFSALRAVATGAAFPRTGADGFDFTAVFFDLATALAMTLNQSARGEEIARLTPL